MPATQALARCPACPSQSTEPFKSLAVDWSDGKPLSNRFYRFCRSECTILVGLTRAVHVWAGPTDANFKPEIKTRRAHGGLFVMD